ncbi:hypothetical protein P154DRAFT_597401 [Amniculicola lignicola CBS 123094]|uniref:Uncharacterized protein n=1 Tax=Amniculicola lignicola CBS 123094 TaxID=1392246 RepID=A0A6A5WZ43_9PLEO|nr:hypothetical protein P154DRAFT_597401 [Amniculicola lignicola CBS 123094]
MGVFKVEAQFSPLSHRHQFQATTATMPRPAQSQAHVIPVYSKFPSCYLRVLPQNMQSELGLVTHCICPSCTPDIHKQLVPHYRLGTTSSGQPCRWKDSPKYGCTTRGIVPVMEDHLAELKRRSSNGGFDRYQKVAMDDFAVYLYRLRKAVSRRKIRDYPDLKKLTIPLSKIFFNGVLDNVEYKWRNLDADNDLGVTNMDDDSGKITIKVHPCTLSFRDGATESIQCTARERGERFNADYVTGMLFNTILHEMIHALMFRHLCMGRCKNAGQAERDLCEYLAHRGVEGFDEFRVIVPGRSQPMMYGLHGHAPNEEYRAECGGGFLGHGPVFHCLNTAVQDAFRTVFAKQLGYVSVVDTELPISELNQQDGCSCQGCAQATYGMSRTPFLRVTRTPCARDYIGEHLQHVLLTMVQDGSAELRG